MIRFEVGLQGRRSNAQKGRLECRAYVDVQPVRTHALLRLLPRPSSLNLSKPARDLPCLSGRPRSSLPAYTVCCVCLHVFPRETGSLPGYIISTPHDLGPCSHAHTCGSDGCIGGGKMEGMGLREHPAFAASLAAISSISSSAVRRVAQGVFSSFVATRGVKSLGLS